MTEPLQPPVSPWAADDARRKWRAVRAATDRLTVLMLLATAGVAAVAWIEPVQRLFDGPQAPAARRGIAQLARAHGWAASAPEPTGHPRIRGGSLDPSNLRPAPRDPHGLLELLAPEGDDDDREDAKLVARKPFPLRDRADESGRVLGTVPAGAHIRVVRDLGEWLLVTPGGGRPLFGWVRRDEI
jgi:hypothetical protein